jgi:hypothetical protein
MGMRGQDRFAQQGGEGALVLGDPRLEVIEAMVALRLVFCTYNAAS